MGFKFRTEERRDSRRLEERSSSKAGKKGDLCSCGKWRGIMLLSIPSKVLTQVILNRIKVAVDEALKDEQAGFKKDRSCIDQIATLRIIVEQTIEWSSPPCTFYSWILRKPSILWIGRLCGYSIPNKIINMLKVQYQGCTCTSASWRNYDRAVAVPCGT